MLVSKPLACTTNPGLHFIENQQHAPFITQLTQPLQERLIGDVDAPFALNGLQQDRARLVINQLSDRFQVVEGCVSKAGNQRAQAFVILRLSRRRHCRERPPMESIRERDRAELLRPAVQPSQLDRPFIRFRTAVRKERLTEAASTNRLGKITLSFRVPRIRHMDQMFNLLLNRLHHFRWAMTQDVAAPARKQVQVPLPFRIPDRRPFPVDDADGIALVVRNHIFSELLNSGLAGSSGGGMHGSLTS
jgi:hypothetical protein